MKVKFWGVRGSIPCPGPSTAEFGGNTSCIQVLGGEEIVVLDAGTGIRELGLELVRQPGPLRVHLLLTHTHWDHIQGFPFFTPIYSPGNEIVVYGPRALAKSLEEALMIQLQYAFFPVRGVELAAKVRFKELDSGPFKIGDMEFFAKPMNHPIQVLAYKFTDGKSTGVYTGDNEPYYDAAVKPGKPDTGMRHRLQFLKERNEEVIQFVRGSDLLIADAQYTDEEYEGGKRGWGHSSIGSVIDLAVRADVQKLAIFHHEPLHDDRRMAEIEKQAVGRAAKASKKLKVFVAREGKTVDV